MTKQNCILLKGLSKCINGKKKTSIDWLEIKKSHPRRKVGSWDLRWYMGTLCVLAMPYLLSWAVNRWMCTNSFYSKFFSHSVCLTLYDPTDCSTPGFPVLHPLLELVQTHVHWVGDAIQPSHPLSACLQSYPASRSFLMSQLFASGGQSSETSTSTSVLPVTIQGWFPLGLTGLISLVSEGFSRVFSNTTVRKHQFFGIQPSLWSNFHIHTWLLEKP